MRYAGKHFIERVVRLRDTKPSKKALDEVRAWLAMSHALYDHLGRRMLVFGTIAGEGEWHRIAEVRVKKGRCEARYPGLTPEWQAVTHAGFAFEQVIEKAAPEA